MTAEAFDWSKCPDCATGMGNYRCAEHRVQPPAGEWPKTCACCGRVYPKLAFSMLNPPRAGNGRVFTGYVADGVRHTLEFRDCPCGNTLTNLTEEAA